MKLDLAVNVASMQEMTMDVVNNYFAYLEKTRQVSFTVVIVLKKHSLMAK